MSGSPIIDRRSLRRQATIDEIITEAWQLSREHGLGNFSMRELGNRVGMRAQSLYSYFASKTEIFDAMFLQGNQKLLDELEPLRHDDTGNADSIAAIDAVAETFVRFCTQDPTRYQLLFQRTLPDFTPSAESYAVAQRAYDVMVAPLRRLGIDDAGLDLFSAVLGGLVSQQISNEPGGDRWTRLTEQSIRMLLHELDPGLVAAPLKGNRT